tara:strand:- start:604 stop:843 length:240 start_codon:yes stop_codon:yes gene_type:complete
MEKNIVILLLLIALFFQNFQLVKRVDFLTEALSNHFNFHENENLLKSLQSPSFRARSNQSNLVLTEKDGLSKKEVDSVD